MSAAEINKIKLNLISWIYQLSDIQTITFLDGLKHSTSKGDWWEDLNAEQKEAILSGLKDAEIGNLISSNTFWKKLKDA